MPQMDAYMDPSEVGASFGDTTIDHGWKKRLEDAIKNTSPAASLKAALAPLAIFGEIEIDILMAIVEGQSEEWRHRLHDPAGGTEREGGRQHGPAGRLPTAREATRNTTQPQKVVIRMFTS